MCLCCFCTLLLQICWVGRLFLHTCGIRACVRGACYKTPESAESLGFAASALMDSSWPSCKTGLLWLWMQLWLLLWLLMV